MFANLLDLKKVSFNTVIDHKLVLINNTLFFQSQIKP